MKPLFTDKQKEKAIAIFSVSKFSEFEFENLFGLKTTEYYPI